MCLLNQFEILRFFFTPFRFYAICLTNNFLLFVVIFVVVAVARSRKFYFEYLRKLPKNVKHVYSFFLQFVFVTCIVRLFLESSKSCLYFSVHRTQRMTMEAFSCIASITLYNTMLCSGISFVCVCVLNYRYCTRVWFVHNCNLLI